MEFFYTEKVDADVTFEIKSVSTKVGLDHRDPIFLLRIQSEIKP